MGSDFDFGMEEVVGGFCSSFGGFLVSCFSLYTGISQAPCLRTDPSLTFFSSSSKISAKDFSFDLEDCAVSLVEEVEEGLFLNHGFWTLGEGAGCFGLDFFSVA